jgi:hypothetical protein
MLNNVTIKCYLGITNPNVSSQILMEYVYARKKLQDVFVKHKCPQIALTAMHTLQLLKSRSNAKVKTSNHLFHYSSDITGMKNDHKPWKGLVI